MGKGERRARDRRPAHRLHRFTHRRRCPGHDPDNLPRPRRRFSGTAQPRPLSPRCLFRHPGPPQRSRADSPFDRHRGRVVAVHGPDTGTDAVTGQLCCCLSWHRACAETFASSGELPHATSQTDNLPDVQHATPISDALSDAQREAFSALLLIVGSRSKLRPMSANTQYFDSPVRVMQTSNARKPTRGGMTTGQRKRLFTGASVSEGSIRMRAAYKSLLAISATM